MVHTGVYEYDITACYYNILKSIGAKELSNVAYIDKKTRNIQLGLLQRDNPGLAKFLIASAETLISSTIDDNNLDRATDIIDIKRDGFISKKPLTKISIGQPLILKHKFKIFIKSCFKYTIYIAIDDYNNIHIKGMSKYPINTNFYYLFNDLNFNNKSSITDQLSFIRRKYFKSELVSWFSIENTNNGNVEIPLKIGGFANIKKSVISELDPDDIDKNRMWNEYMWPFVKAILIDYIY